jgi:hypothetical protein
VNKKVATYPEEERAKESVDAQPSGILEVSIAFDDELKVEKLLNYQ